MPDPAWQARCAPGSDRYRQHHPGDLNKFSPLGGAEANENAIKLARQFTGKQKIIARYRSYHGATAGAISLTGDYRRWANEPGMPGVVRVLIRIAIAVRSARTTPAAAPWIASTTSGK